MGTQCITVYYVYVKIGYNVPLDTLQVILGTIFPSDHLTGAKMGFNPFSLTVFQIVAKMSLPKRSAPYWSNPRF